MDGCGELLNQEKIAHLSKVLVDALGSEGGSMSLDNNNRVNNGGHGSNSNGSGNRAGDKGRYKGLGLP
jgi:hypothetical protein